MPFTTLLEDTVTVYRLVSVSDKETYSLVGSLTCNMQEASKEQALLSGGAYGQTWNLYADDDADLQPADKIEFNDGVETVTMYVREFRRLTTGGRIQHIEAVCTQALKDT